MPEPARQLKIKVGFPWIISVETDDVLGLFQRVDDHVIPQACAHVIPRVLAYACFT